MMKKFILALATIGLLATLPSCTSKDSKNEDVVAEDGAAADMAAQGEGAADNAGLDESLDTAQTTDTTANPDANVAGTATDDQLTIDSFGDSGAAAPAPTTTAENPPMDMAAPAAEPPIPTTTEPTTTTGVEEIAPPPAAPEVPEQKTAKAETDLDHPKPASKSLQKAASAPWKVGTKWVNGIYFVRPGDSLSSISRTVYGDNRTKELKKINPTYANREVKPGDKVYYSSTARPEDSDKILNFYEEKNIPAKTYVAKAGDNIRKVSQELLGYPEAWKEVWASNSVESKQDIPEGTELRYWETQAHMGSPNLADTAPTTPPADMAQNTPPAAHDLPPPPDMNNAGTGAAGTTTAANDLPPPPPPMDNAPPPPPPMEAAPPPPPPPPPPPVAQNTPPPNPAAAHVGAEDAAGGEENSTLAAGAIAVAVLGAVALIIVRRKRKQKEMDQALGETHVG